MQGTEPLSELENESVKYYRALQQGTGFRGLIQVVVPALNAIGTEKPSLVIESVNLLSSSKYIGNMDILMARSSARGLESLTTIPDVASYLKNQKLDYLTDLLNRRSQIATADWKDYCRILQNILNLIQKNESNDIIPKEKFCPPNTQYEAIAYLRKIITPTKTNLKITDPYANVVITCLIEACDPGINIRILTGGKKYRGLDDFLLAAGLYKKQYGHIEVKSDNNLEQHDRFIIVDDNKVYHLGDSISHIAEKTAAIIDEITTPEAKKEIITFFNTAWESAVQKI